MYLLGNLELTAKSTPRYPCAIAQINTTGAIGILHRNMTDQTIQVRDFSQSGTPVENEKYKPEILIAPYIRELLGEVKQVPPNQAILGGWFNNDRPEDDPSQLAECLITDFEDSVALYQGYTRKLSRNQWYEQILTLLYHIN